MSPRTVHGFEQAGGEVEMAAGAPITVTETSKGEFRVELSLDPNTLKVNDNGALEGKVIGAEASTPLTVSTSNDIRTFALNFDNNSLVVKDNALRLAGKYIIHAAPTSGLFMVPDATTGEMYLNYKTDNDTVARDSILGELHLRRVPVKDKGGFTETEVLYTPIPGDPGTPGVKWYELSLNYDNITTFLDPRNGTLHAEPGLLTNSGIRKEDLLNNMRSIGLSVDNLTAVIEPRPNNPDGSAHPGLLRSIPVVAPNAGLEVQNFSETETYPKRLAVLVDGSTIKMVDGKVTGGYESAALTLPTDPHVTVTGNVLGLSNVVSQLAFGAFELEVAGALERIENPLVMTPTQHPLWFAVEALQAQMLLKQGSHTNLTNLSSDTPFLDKPLEIREETKVKRLVVTDTSALAAPSMTARSAGTRAVLWPGTFGGTNTDMALGVEANHVWMSSYSPDQGFKWYTGDVLRMHLQGTSGVLELKAKPTVNGKVVRVDGESIMTDGPANGNISLHHELRAGDMARWSWITRGGGTAGVAGAQVLALQRHNDDGTAAMPTAEAFAIDRYTGVTDFKFRPTHNGTALATVGDVSASAFSTFPNDTWINSAEGAPRLYFQNGAETIFRAANSTFYFRTYDNVANVLALDTTRLQYGLDSAPFRHFEVKNTNPASYTLLAVIADQAAGGCDLYVNGSTRSADGGANTTTLRANPGALRLQAKGAKGISVAADTGNVTLDGDLGFNGYRKIGIPGGNLTGYLYGAYNTLGEGIHLGCNAFNDNAAWTVPVAWGATSRLRVADGIFQFFTGAAGQAPLTERFRVSQTGAESVGPFTLGADSPLLVAGGYVENKVLHAYWDGYKRVMDICMPGDYRGYGASSPTPRITFTANEMTVTYTKQAASQGDAALIVQGGVGVAKQVHAGDRFVCNAGTGGTFHYVMQTGAKNRWAWGLSHPEGGTVDGSHLVLYSYQNDGTTPTAAATPIWIDRPTGVVNFQARPTFNGSALALLSEVTGGGGTFTTFNNDAWINSADGKNRLWFSANDWSILNSPTGIGFRTGNASAGPDKMVLDANGCLAQTVSGTGITLPLSAMQAGLAAGQFNGLQIGKAASTYNSARVLYNHSADNSINNAVTVGLWGCPALSVDGNGSTLLQANASQAYQVGAGSYGQSTTAGAYFSDSAPGNVVLRAQNQTLLMGTLGSRNADMRIETDGTVKFAKQPFAVGSEVVTLNGLALVLDSLVANMRTFSWTLASDFNLGTNSGADPKSWTWQAAPVARGKRARSHLRFDVHFSGYVPAANTLTYVKLFLNNGSGSYVYLAQCRFQANQANNHYQVSFMASTMDVFAGQTFSTWGFDNAVNIDVKLEAWGWITLSGQSFVNIGVTELYAPDLVPPADSTYPVYDIDKGRI